MGLRIRLPSRATGGRSDPTDVLSMHAADAPRPTYCVHRLDKFNAPNSISAGRYTGTALRTVASQVRSRSGLKQRTMAVRAQEIQFAAETIAAPRPEMDHGYFNWQDQAQSVDRRMSKPPHENKDCDKERHHDSEIQDHELVVRLGDQEAFRFKLRRQA